MHFLKFCQNVVTKCCYETLLQNVYVTVKTRSKPILETSIRDLKISEAHTFEKARLIGLELRRKQGLIQNLSR